MSEQVKLGKVAMTLGGDYSSSQSYDKLTCVHYDGCSWVSKKQVPEGVAPTPANTAYWQKISDRGLQGATGAPGQSYVDKELVPIVNDLTTGGSANVLSAEQGKVLDGKLTELSKEINAVHSEIETMQTEMESQSELIEDLQNTKIDKEADDYYPQLSVGVADNLAGHEDATPSEIGFRRSGGGAILDGNARIEAIKGNSVVWNQVIDYTLDSRTTNGITFTKNGDNSYAVSGELTSTEAYAFISSQFNQIKDHKYLLINDSDGSVTMGGYNIGGMLPTGTTKIVTCGMSGLQAIALRVTATGAINTTIHPAVIDLTKMFGAGNEPTTIEEFYARKPLGIDEYAYNEGEVIHNATNKIESVGVNQWDEEWRKGSYDNQGNSTSTDPYVATKNPVKVLPNKEYHFSHKQGNAVFVVYWYDNNMKFISRVYLSNNATTISPNGAYYMNFRMQETYGTTYNHDICINLSDPSVNGKYFPYVKREQNLDIIGKYFPNGMKSAGTAHDEIRYNKVTQKWEKVEAIGTRAYQDGDADNASYLTDGRTTCYPLAEPIVTEIEETFNLDYPVWNVGTEKADANVPSTPLKADIIYGFNAYGVIKELLARVASLEAANASLASQLASVTSHNEEV